MLEGEGFRIKVEVLLRDDLKLDWSERLIRISDIVEKMEERGGRFRTGDVNLTFDNSDGYFEETAELWQEETWINKQIQLTLIGVEREWEEILFLGYLQRKEDRGKGIVMFKARDLIYSWLQGLVVWSGRETYNLSLHYDLTGGTANDHSDCRVLKIDQALDFWATGDKTGFEQFWNTDANWETVSTARHRNRKPTPLQNPAEIFFDLMTHVSPTGVLPENPEVTGWKIARGIISPWIWYSSWMKLSLYPIEFERTLTPDKEWRFFDLLEELTRPLAIAFYMKAGKVAFDAIEPEFIERSFFLPRDWIREEEKHFEIQDMFNSVLWKLRTDETEHFHYSPGFKLSKEKYNFVRTFEIETGWIRIPADGIGEISHYLDRFAERLYARYGIPVENRKVKVPVGIFESRLNDLVEVEDPWVGVRRFRIFEIRKKFFPSEVSLTFLPADEYWQKWMFWNDVIEGATYDPPVPDSDLRSTQEGRRKEEFGLWTTVYFESNELPETLTTSGYVAFTIDGQDIEATEPVSDETRDINGWVDYFNDPDIGLKPPCTAYRRGNRIILVVTEIRHTWRGIEFILFGDEYKLTGQLGFNMTFTSHFGFGEEMEVKKREAYDLY